MKMISSGSTGFGQDGPPGEPGPVLANRHYKTEIQVVNALFLTVITILLFVGNIILLEHGIRFHYCNP
jgi:hypothetical protein